MKSNTEREHAIAALTEAVEAMAGDAPSLDDQYDLLTAWGQAARLADEAPSVLIARAAEAWRAGGGTAAALGAFDEAAAILELEALLDDPEIPDVEIFTLLLDLDGHATAASVIDAGPTASLEHGETLLAIHRERAASLSAAAASYMSAAGVAPDDPAYALWQSLVRAADDPAPAQPVDDAFLDAILDAQAQDGVLVLLRPAATAPRAATGWAKAANDGFAPEAAATALAEGADWELVLETPGPRMEVALYTAPDVIVTFALSIDGEALVISDDGEGRRAAVIPDVARIEAQVGDQRFDLRVPAPA